MFELWPFTNFHDLNLDWIIRTIKVYTKKVDDFIEDMTESWDTFKNVINHEIAEMHRKFAIYVNVTEEALNTGAIADGAVTEPKLDEDLFLKVVNDYVTPEMFGALGDGVNDDTSAVQNAIDYAADNDLNKVVLEKVYKITAPLKIPYRRSPNFWNGDGITLEGVNRNDSKIVKEGTVTEGGIDTVLYAYNESNDDTQTGSGVIIKELSLINNSSSTSALAIWGNFCRSTFTGLNIKSYKGIYSPSGFCNKYDDIVFEVHEKALETSGQCTGGVYTRLYAPQAANPYIIKGGYSNIDLIYGDGCTGVFLTLATFMGISIGTIGTESPDLDCVVELTYNNVYAENTGITIRQIDMENLSTDNASILKISKGDVRLDTLNILYNYPVADVYLLDFNNKSYGSATIGAVNHISNTTTYNATKFHQVKNATAGNTWTRSGKTLNTTFRNDGAQFLGQALQSVHTQEPDRNSNKTIMMNVTKMSTGWKQSETEEGVTYRAAPDNGGMVLMDYSKSEFGAATAYPVFDTTGTPQTFEYYRYALGLMAVFKAGAPSAWTNFTPKEGILWVDTTGHKLYIYLGGAWKTITTS